MVFMCGRFICSSFMFMMIVCVMCCVFQRMVVMAEDCLVSKFPMQPADKGFVKIYDINRESNDVQCVLHFQFDAELVIKKDTKIRKKQDRK